MVFVMEVAGNRGADPISVGECAVAAVAARNQGILTNVLRRVGRPAQWHASTA